jgi:mitochondrial fission protein ELM1
VIIWALLDDRAGNVGQVLGLANAISLPYEVKNLAYNKLVSLPNFIRGASLIGVLNQEIIKEPFPDLVITAGRRSAPIARYIKKHSPKTKLVQIMSPDCGYGDFDLIVLPTHDKKSVSKNIATTIGSLHKLTQETLDSEAIIWGDKFSHINPPYISLLIGGNSKSGVFTKEHARELGNMANNMAIKLGASLLITTSRRTDIEARDLLLAQISVQYHCYSYGDLTDNPYLGYLSLADYLIVTGDSISMASECCYTGKPVFIYAPDNITGDKHKLFHQILFDNDYAAKFSDDESIYGFKAGKILDETSKIANIIKTIL